MLLVKEKSMSNHNATDQNPIALPPSRWQRIYKGVGKDDGVRRTSCGKYETFGDFWNDIPRMAEKSPYGQYPLIYEAMARSAQEGLPPERLALQEGGMLLDPIAQSLVYLLNPDGMMEYGNPCTVLDGELAHLPAAEREARLMRRLEEQGVDLCALRSEERITYAEFQARQQAAVRESAEPAQPLRGPDGRLPRAPAGRPLGNPAGVMERG